MWPVSIFSSNDAIGEATATQAARTPKRKLQTRHAGIVFITSLRRRPHPRRYTVDANARNTVSEIPVYIGLLPLPERHIAGSIACGGLSGRVQGFEKCHQRGCLRRTQVLAVGRHVASSLNHLPDELILCEAHRDAVQVRAPLPSFFT